MSNQAVIPSVQQNAYRTMGRKRATAFGIVAAILCYCIYIFFSFDMVTAFSRAKTNNAAILVADAYSYKTLLTRYNRSDEYVLAIEGEKKGTYTDDQWPGWVQRNAFGDAEITLGDGYDIFFEGDKVSYVIPDYGTVIAVASRKGIDVQLPSEKIPEFISLSKTRLDVKTAYGRMSVTKAKTIIYRYFFGWELFWFTLDSDYYGKSLSELISLASSVGQDSKGRSYLNGMLHDFWYNKMWRHGEVAWALVETILMAFLGTFGAAAIALPLAFLSARNFMNNLPFRMVIRRVFDFLRGVDGLIWTIILSRAFGPGPLTGALAILLTDTGTFGKLFSEALENVDNKQIEGIQSTGSSRLQTNRFGVIPQLMPVLLSQMLYYFESNTRSATIIGAIVGGGIGLLLTQAIITQKDWEEVSYYIILIILMVISMDSLSSWLRRRLIKGEK